MNYFVYLDVPAALIVPDDLGSLSDGAALRTVENLVLGGFLLTLSVFGS